MSTNNDSHRRIHAPETHVDGARVDDPGLDKFPPVGGLERWERRARERMEAEIAAKKAPLDLAEVRAIFAGIDPDVGDIERELLSGIALFCWGSEHVGSARRAFQRRAEDAVPFDSLRELLTAAVYGEAELGRRRGTELRIELPTERGDPARVGHDYMHASPSRSGGGGVASIGAVDRAIDARRGIRASLLSPFDLFAIVATVVGIPAVNKRGRLGAPEKVAAGELAEQQRGRLCREAGRVPGAAPCPARKAAKPTKGANAKVVAHAAGCPAATITASSIGRRIANARGRLIRVLAEMRLLPAPRERTTKLLTPAEKKQRRLERRGGRIEPVRASFAGTGGRW